LAILLEVFDRQQGLAVEHSDELDTGVDRAVAQPVSVKLDKDARAGAAIAFRASLLASYKPLAFAQITQHSQRGIDLFQPPDLAVQYEFDCATHESSLGRPAGGAVCAEVVQERGFCERRHRRSSGETFHLDQNRLRNGRLRKTRRAVVVG